MQAGATPLTFVQLTTDGGAWRYCNANRDVEWKRHLWQATTSTIEVFQNADDPRLEFLTPLPSRPTRKRPSLFTSHVITSGYWKLAMPVPTGEFALEGKGCDVKVQWNVPFGAGEWFTIQTFVGKVLRVNKQGIHKVVFDCVDKLEYMPWIGERYSVQEIADLVEGLKDAEILLYDNSGGNSILLVKAAGKEWVVGESADVDVLRDAAYDVSRALRRRHGFGPARLYKYMKREYAEQLLDGRILISPAYRFNQGTEVLTEGQTDDETTKITKMPSVSEIVRMDDDVHGTSMFDEERGDLSMTSDPYWMWCASMSRSPMLFPEFKADVVVELTNTEDFCSRLRQAGCNALDCDSEASWIGMVDYEGHQDFVYYGLVKTNISHPSMMKHRRFEHQQEIRCVWINPRNRPEPDPESGGHLICMGSNRHCARIVSCL